MTTTFKTMTKVSKVLASRDLPACAENCVTVKEEVAAFKAFVPLVQALRNPGMRDRHWDELSERLGVDLHPDDSFTLVKAQVRPATMRLGTRRHRSLDGVHASDSPLQRPLARADSTLPCRSLGCWKTAS